MADEKNKIDYLSAIHGILLFFAIVLIFFLLYFLASLLIPLVFTLLIAILYQPLIRILKERKAPTFLIAPLLTLFTISVVYTLGVFLSQSASNFIAGYPEFHAKLIEKTSSLVSWFEQIPWIEQNKEIVDNFKADTAAAFGDALSSVAESLGNFTNSFMTFLIYFIFVMAGITNFDHFVAHVVGAKNLQSIRQIQNSVSYYMSIKIGISLFTSVCVLIVCLVFGLKFALLWAFVTFILNFIPTIGSILATLFPLLTAIVEFDSIFKVVALFALLLAIQFTVGNIIETKIVGNIMKLNSVTVLFGLIFWGRIWGIPGMLLAVPLLVTLKLLFEKQPATKAFARLMASP